MKVTLCEVKIGFTCSRPIQSYNYSTPAHWTRDRALALYSWHQVPAEHGILLRCTTNKLFYITYRKAAEVSKSNEVKFDSHGINLYGQINLKCNELNEKPPSNSMR